MDETKVIDLGPAELDEARHYSMQIAWSPEDGAYVVSFPDIPGAHTHGATPAEAAEMGEEVIALWLAGLRGRGMAIPAPPRTARRTLVDTPPAFDAERIQALRQRLNLSQPVFAAALNVRPATVKAWEQGQRAPDGASLRLLEIADRHPAVVVRTVKARPSLIAPSGRERPTRAFARASPRPTGGRREG